jgi:hypothetical protein
MPAANQFKLAVLRMKSTRLSQVVGAGESTLSILKFPLEASGTPARSELCSINGAAALQISVANTRCPVALPTLLLCMPKLNPYGVSVCLASQWDEGNT